MATYSYPNVQMGVPIDDGIPVAQTIGRGGAPRVSRQSSLSFLQSVGMPDGLNEAFLKSGEDFPLRIWVVDNSGSMQTVDGKRIVFGPGGREAVVESSRWAELGDSIVWHATLAAHLGAPTEIRLLNPPGHSSPQVLSVGLGGDPAAEIEAVKRLITTGPTGRTPLCEQIRQVVARIEAQAASLRANGQKVVVVIASDGAATDGDVEQAMRPLQGLPVWIIVRLCTDNDEVVKYWNQVDEDLELDFDVLDDLSGEAAEIAELNGWLTYAAPLHRLREWGCTNKVFDLIDEKSLSISEMKALVEFILGGAALDLPNPQIDFSGFEEGLGLILKTAKPVWDPLRNRKRPWFSTGKIRKAYSTKGCLIM